MGFIFVAKPDDHKIMMEWIGEQEQMGEVKKRTTTDEKGRTHVYEWINQVPLNGNDETVTVNFFRYQLIAVNKRGESGVTYVNSWVTDL